MNRILLVAFFCMQCSVFFPPGQIVREVDNAIIETAKLPDSPEKAVILNALRNAKDNANSQASVIRSQAIEIAETESVRSQAAIYRIGRNLLIGFVFGLVAYIYLSTLKKIP